MKKTFLSLMLAVLIPATLFAASGKLVSKVEPPYWWTGMANDTLQLFVYGDNVKNAALTVDYPGVSIVDEARLDGSDNYKIVYLTVAPDTKPGKMTLNFKSGRKTEKVPYELKARTWNPADNPGFDASDVLYLIMPDRFSDGDTSNNDLPQEMRNRGSGADRERPNARHGGDIKGMRNHLDYIENLGVTAIWVNPVLANIQQGGSYHGYATTDYYNIDPRFGSNEEWRGFVDASHEKGLKVVMDMIFNHCGSDHVWLTDVPSSDWFNHWDEFAADGSFVGTAHNKNALFDPYASEVDVDRTVNGWFVRSMPDLNQRNRHLMNYLIQNSIFWIEDSHIDGIRMDTYPYADMKEMARWVDAVEREYPRFNIVGECWYGSDAANAFWQRGSKVNDVDPRLKTVMDFIFVRDGEKVFNEQTTWEGTGLYKVYEHLTIDYLYPDPQHILTFLDNHDTDRFLRKMPENLAAWKQAMALLLTTRGIPQIYYGTEILMHGTKEKGDAAIRLDMPGGFPGDTVSVFTREGRSNLQNEAYDYLSQLLKWRKSAPANDVIARGRLKHFAPVNGIYVYTRELDGRRVVVLMNGTDSEKTLDTDYYAEILGGGRSFKDVLSGKACNLDGKLRLAPRDTLIMSNF